MRVILTGPKQTGKSTLVRRLIVECGWALPAGFITRRVEGNPGAPSLLIAPWGGHPTPVARWTATDGGFTLDAHRLDDKALAEFAWRHLANLPEHVPVVLDELGSLELRVEQFTKVIAALFQHHSPVLAIVQERALNPWLALIGSQHVDRIERMDRANCDHTLAVLIRLLKPPPS